MGAAAAHGCECLWRSKAGFLDPRCSTGRQVQLPTSCRTGLPFQCRAWVCPCPAGGRMERGEEATLSSTAPRGSRSRRRMTIITIISTKESDTWTRPHQSLLRAAERKQTTLPTSTSPCLPSPRGLSPRPSHSSGLRCTSSPSPSPSSSSSWSTLLRGTAQ